MSCLNKSLLFFVFWTSIQCSGLDLSLIFFIIILFHYYFTPSRSSVCTSHSLLLYYLPCCAYCSLTSSQSNKWCLVSLNLWIYHGIAGSQRYFVLDKGILVYGKSPGDLARGKVHGSVDVGLSVISTKSKRKRLDIDAEEFIHHLKVSETLVFVAVDKRLYLYYNYTLLYLHNM